MTLLGEVKLSDVLNILENIHHVLTKMIDSNIDLG